MATKAQELLATLAARGWSYGRIGQAVGRDPSLIRQGALGKKPLTNLLPSLEHLVATGKGSSAALTEHVEVPRRQRAGGGEAATRGHPQARLPTLPRVGETRILPGGQVYERVRSTQQAQAYLAGLRPEQHVTISYRGKDGQWHSLGKKGGYRVAVLQARMRGPRGGKRTWMSVVGAIAAEVYGKAEAAAISGAMELSAR